MALTQNTTTDSSITAEEVQISTSFTGVANRYYKITYFEPNIVGGTGYFAFRIRQGTTTAGTLLNISYNTAGTGIDRQATMIWVGTFSAGTVNVVATAQVVARPQLHIF
jgi:hypothetical protein